MRIKCLNFLNKSFEVGKVYADKKGKSDNFDLLVNQDGGVTIFECILNNATSAEIKAISEDEGYGFYIVPIKDKQGNEPAFNIVVRFDNDFIGMVTLTSKGLSKADIETFKSDNIALYIMLYEGSTGELKLIKGFKFDTEFWKTLYQSFMKSHQTPITDEEFNKIKSEYSQLPFSKILRDAAYKEEYTGTKRDIFMNK